jgi:hypothetical protein
MVLSFLIKPCCQIIFLFDKNFVNHFDQAFFEKEKVRQKKLRYDREFLDRLRNIALPCCQRPRKIEEWDRAVQ